jgi:hypothetical protein
MQTYVVVRLHSSEKIRRDYALNIVNLLENTFPYKIQSSVGPVESFYQSHHHYEILYNTVNILSILFIQRNVRVT